MKWTYLLVCVLLLAGEVFGASFGFNGTTNSTTFSTDSAISLHAQTATTGYRTGVVGDRVDSIHVYAERSGGENDSIQVGLYESPFQPRKRLYLDTIVITGAAGWYSTGNISSANFILVQGVDYKAAMGVIDDATVTVYYDNGGFQDAHRSTRSLDSIAYVTTGAFETRKYAMLVFYTPMTYSWGGPTKHQNTDSILSAMGRSDNATANWGGDVEIQSKTDGITGSGCSPTYSFWIRMANDPRTSGYTQDSIRLYLCQVDSLGGTDDSILLELYTLNKTWGEGTKLGTAAGAGESSWDSSVTGTTAWTSQAGGTASGDHTPTTLIASRWLKYPGPTDVVAQREYWYITIPAASITNNMFTYGIVGQFEDQRNVTFLRVGFGSDDATVETPRRKPYFVGWETAPVGGVLSIGVTSFGVVTVGK